MIPRQKRAVAVFAAALALTPPAAKATPDIAEDVSWSSLPGFAKDDHVAALKIFLKSCMGKIAGKRERAALAPPPALAAACAEGRALGRHPSEKQARAFFETAFAPRRVGAEGSAFFTGYYEPLVEGALTQMAAFPAPLYAPPQGLVARSARQPLPGLDASLNAGLRRPDGTIVPLPDRAAIDAGALAGAAEPLAYVRDAAEAFFIQVQGSARIRLPDGSMRRLVYAGRNGYPYTSIGKVLVQTLNIPPDQMGLTQLKSWIREHGQGPDDAGTRLMQRNRSYIFFAFDHALPANAGPVGGAGLSLTPLRSLAIDHNFWPYGLPYYIDAVMPWQDERPTPFQRLMLGQDTGSAIVGANRADIFFGSGADAARLAGPIRHPGTLYVLWPRGKGRTR